MIYYLPNNIRLFAYVLMLLGLLLQSQLVVVEKFRMSSAFDKLKEIVFLIIQLLLVTLATYNLSNMNNLGIAYYFKYSVITYPIFMTIFIRTIFIGIDTLKKVNEEITSFSILESLDNLDSGLTVYETDGQIILNNKKMKEVINALFPKVYKNGNRLWEDINNYPSKVKNEKNIVMIKSEGTIYEFSINSIHIKGKTYKELLASDVTKIYNQLAIIEKENKELDESYKEVDKMIEEINEIVDMEEKIRLKVYLHDSLGYQFTLMRSLVDNYDKYDGNLELIRPLEILENLKKDPEKSPKETLNEIREFFKNIGIKIKVVTETILPKDIANVFSLIAIEGITNGIIHGDAKNFLINYYEEGEYYVIKIENDGISSEGKIIEGGGLKGMRFRLKPYGGILEIQSKKPFTIFAKIKKNTNHLVDSNQ